MSKPWPPLRYWLVLFLFSGIVFVLAGAVHAEPWVYSAIGVGELAVGYFIGRDSR